MKQNGANLLRAADYKKTLPAQMEDKNRTKRASFAEIDFGPQITILGQTIPLFKITFLSPTVLTLVAFSPSFNQVSK